MEFTEIPAVDGIERKIEFKPIKWLNKVRFEELVVESKRTNQLNVYPCLNEHETIDKRVFIGKTIARQPPQLFRFGGVNRLNRVGSCPYQYLEIVGSVYKSNEKGNVWKLRITHEENVYEIDDDFLVLSIEDPDSFYWCSNVDENQSFIKSNFYEFKRKEQKYALRAAVDKIDQKYTYVGRSLEESRENGEPVIKRPKFYSNGWYSFDDIPRTFGRINRTYNLLFVPHKNLEIGCDQHETLCLKASPASLKNLCRSAVRSYLNYSQKNIKSLINSNETLLPVQLVNFLKYPSFLKVGEFMMNDEKLVREDDKYELAIDENGNLVCRELYHDENDNRELKTFVLANNIDIICLHYFQTIFYNGISSLAYTAHSLYDTLQSYKFFVEWEERVPTSQIKPLV